MVRQSGLGKGLGALLPSPGIEGHGASGSTAGRLVDIPIASIRPNAFQPRSHFDDEGIEALAASIRELGVLQPILVRVAENNEYELIAGERRWRAARRAGLSSVPAVVRTADDHDALEQALVENLHRADLNPLEEAAAYQQLVDDFGLTHDQVAARVGKSRASISNTLRLFQLSPAIQRMLLEDGISAGHARALLGTTDKSFQEALARRIVNEGLSVRVVEEHVRTRVQGPTKDKLSKPATVRDRAAGLIELETLLGQLLDTRISVQLSPNKRGRFVVDFADLNDLERIVRVIEGGAHPGPD